MSVYTVLPLIASVANLFLGGLVIGKKPSGRINRVWAFLCLCLAIWSLGTFALYISHDKVLALSWLKLYNAGVVLIPAAFLHFALVLAGDKSQSGKIALAAAYSMSAIFFALGFTPLFNKGVEYHFWGYYPILGSANIVFDLGFVIFLSFSGFKLIKRYRTASGRYKNQLKYVFLAASIGFGSGFTNFLPLYNIKFYPIGHIGILFTGVIITIAIVKYRLMDTSVIIRKSAVYSALTAILAAVYVATVSVFQTIFQGLTGYNSFIAAIAVGFVVALTFEPIHRSTQVLVDRVFFRRNYEYQKVTRKASEHLRTKITLAEISAFLVDTTVDVLQVSRGWLMILDRQSSQYIVTATLNVPDNIKHALVFKKDNHLVSLLEREGGPLLLDEPTQPLLRRKVDSSERRAISELCASIIIPLRVKNELMGMLFLSDKKSSETYNQDDIELLTTLCNQAELSIENSHLYEELQESYLNTVRSLVTALEAKDEYTKGHSERVANYAREIALEFGFSEPEAQLLYEVSLLHDVGKIGVSERILNKPTKLTAKEFSQIRSHAEIGEKILSGVESLKGGLSAVRHHHERLNGNGYPDRLSQINIPLQARILAVADAYDAMTTKRPYRPAMNSLQAIEELKRNSCEQFDPRVVRAFFAVLARKKARIANFKVGKGRSRGHLRTA